MGIASICRDFRMIIQGCVLCERTRHIDNLVVVDTREDKSKYDPTRSFGEDKVHHISGG